MNGDRPKSPTTAEHTEQFRHPRGIHRGKTDCVKQIRFKHAQPSTKHDSSEFRSLNTFMLMKDCNFKFNPYILLVYSE